MPEFDTANMMRLLTRIRSGDSNAQDELVRASVLRLETLARRMLRGFPSVRRLEDTLDLLQNSLLRLLRAIDQVTPANTREFMSLAALQMRRELLDLLRRHRRTPIHECDLAAQDNDEAAAFVAASHADHEDLDVWEAFHAAVERLPADEREVLSLTFYHGWTQPEIAELFGVDERTVRRRWRSACLKLNDAVGKTPDLA